jgi:hypothetical protein
VFVPFSGAEDSDGMELRALDLDDVSLLISGHLGAIANALEIYQDMKADINESGSLDRFVVGLIRMLPDLTAEIIATSAGVPDLAHKARQLAFGVQLRSLSEIVRMTLEDTGGIKNLFAALPSVLAGLQMPQMVQKARTMLTPETNGKLQS